MEKVLDLKDKTRYSFNYETLLEVAKKYFPEELPKDGIIKVLNLFREVNPYVETYPKSNKAYESNTDRILLINE